MNRKSLESLKVENANLPCSWESLRVGAALFNMSPAPQS